MDISQILNDVLCMKYKINTQITQIIIRCQEDKLLDHVFLYEKVRPIMLQIIKNLILRITSNLRSIHPSKITKHIIQQLSDFPYLNVDLQLNNDISLIQFIQGFVPNSLFNFLKDFSCNASEIEHIICSNLNWLIKELHEKIWILRCENL